MTKTLLAVLPVLLAALVPSSLSATVTVGELPSLTGDVFAVQVGPDDVVDLVVFDGGKLYEYTFDAENKKLVLSGQAEYVEIQGPPNNRWQVILDGQILGEFEKASGASLTTNSAATGLTKVEYDLPSRTIPEMPNPDPDSPGCVACLGFSCCGCCYCIHRRLGIPCSLDAVCCFYIPSGRCGSGCPVP